LEQQALKIVIEIIKRYLPAGELSFIVQEGLTILAWVALWRPGELLLYEWYPLSATPNYSASSNVPKCNSLRKRRKQVDEHRDFSAI
jgi:hypothetical protein